MNQTHDIVLIGSIRAKGTLDIEEFLTRNRKAFLYIDFDKNRATVPANVLDTDLPVVICKDQIYRNPSLEQVAEAAGLNVIPAKEYDVVVVGAGPAGLASAIYAGSEGLSTLVLESYAPGGQAGQSSKIENYLGFPEGLSGMDLASKALAQAEKFGAVLAVTRSATTLDHTKRPYSLAYDGSQVIAKAVVVATGARYNKLEIARPYENGLGTYYSATPIEAQLIGPDDEVVVVGGGNSAGQAAMFLANHAKLVNVLVRGNGLKATMSAYLLNRIYAAPDKINVWAHANIVEMNGAPHLSEVVWDQEGTKFVSKAQHVFFMMGATPNAGWLSDCCTTDDHGFLVTGYDLTREALLGKRWPLVRPPYLFETSLPGVFAVGDVRAGSVKRVASAVGEGSAAIQYVHRTIEEVQ